MIEGEVRRQVLLIPQHLCLKLVDLLQAEEGDLYLVLSLYLIAHLLLVLLRRTSYIPQDLQGLTLVVVGNLHEEELSIIGEEVVQQFLEEEERVLI